MRYYLIAGEPSGDLHGANLMKGAAESPSQFLLPAAHAVAVAEDFERPDVDRRIGHERTVHVEYAN